MSTSLYWRPVPVEPEGRCIYSLKWAFAKKFGEYDGSCSENLGVVGSEQIPFLEGIIASGNEEMAEDAQSLIDAIKLHGKVELVIY